MCSSLQKGVEELDYSEQLAKKDAMGPIYT